MRALDAWARRPQPAMRHVRGTQHHACMAVQSAGGVAITATSRSMPVFNLTAASTRHCLNKCKTAQPAQRSLLCAAVSTPSAPTAGAWMGPPVVVVGAGIAGLATALALHRVGVPVSVLEARPTPSHSSTAASASPATSAAVPALSASSGEGSAIGLWANAWRALDALGVGDELRAVPGSLLLDRVELVRSTGTTLRSFRFADTDAASHNPIPPTSSPNTPPPTAPGGQLTSALEFRGVRRSDLLAALAGALPPGTVTYNARVTHVTAAGAGGSGGPWARLDLEGGNSIEAGVVVGTDGARSAVAAMLGLPRAGYAGYAAYRGVAQLQGGIASIGLPPDTIRQIWGEGVRAGLYPLSESEVYWFTCFNADESVSGPPDPAARAADAVRSVQGWAWGVADAIRATPAAAISRSRVVDRWTVGDLGKGLVTLAGDAAHPMTPNLGQGGCVALEDGVELAQAVAQAVRTSSSTDSVSRTAALAAALRQYEGRRRARCLPITVRSYLMGAALQLPYTPVCMARDLVVSQLPVEKHFLDHTLYDCGRL